MANSYKNQKRDESNDPKRRDIERRKERQARRNSKSAISKDGRWKF